jgi:hypothetical protein
MKEKSRTPNKTGQDKRQDGVIILKIRNRKTSRNVLEANKLLNP